MSGAEVMGLVLGAIPLLICGLEHYAEGIHVIRTMWNYEAVMNHLVAEFTLAQGIFRHSCQDLLMPILPDSQAAELLEGGSPHWENPALDKQLRAKLGPDYQVYTRNVTRLRRQIDLFTRKLGLDVETRMPPWISDAKVDKAMRDRFFRDAWRKLKGGFDTSRVETLLADILRNIDQITKFTRGSIAIAPKRIALRRHTNSRYWIKIRDHARRLFDSLSSRWSCACSDPHCASLCLDTRKSSAIHDEKDISFGVLFSYGQKSATKSPDLPPWSWREVEIQPLPIVRRQTTMAIATPLTSAKRVWFSIQSPSRSAAALPASQPSLVSVPEISDLCSVMKQSTKNAGCIGYLEGHDYRQYLHTTARDAHVDGGRELVCLYDVLPRKGTYSLGVKDRYSLALTIASAVLQLHATPWLRAQWCLNDIHFARGSESGPLASRTFVTKTFASPNCRRQSMDLNQQPTLGAYTCVANAWIFALGVALIEISFGVPILELKESADPEIPGFLEFFIATRLVNNNVIKERDHDKYAEVVLRCVKCQLNTLVTPLSLEDVKVQQSFYEDVIFPLQQLNDTLYDGASASTL